MPSSLVTLPYFESTKSNGFAVFPTKCILNAIVSNLFIKTYALEFNFSSILA